MLRRFIPIALIAALLSATVRPAPAGAVSTATEIQQSKEIDKQIVEQYNVVTDPLLNAWTNDVAKKLWAQVARKDVPYNIKILDDADVNAFTTGGGFLYINEGTLDFAQSDDELAGVIGHETGHDERRHPVTLQAKAQALNLLFGIASLFSPFIYRFGQLGEAGLIAKMQRADELQADQYGLLLMTRAGYDPDAMVSFMRHLGALHDEHSSVVDRYFADHPGVPARVSHLLGYPQLDPKRRTTEQVLVAALHDQDEARYSIAARKFAEVLKADPGNPVALLHLGQTQLALGLSAKGEQTLAEAAAKGNPETRSAALARIAALRASERRSLDLTRPNLQPLRAQLEQASTRESEAVTAIGARRDGGKDQLKALQSRIQSVSYSVPNLSRLQVRKGGRLEAVIKNLTVMGRYVDTAMNKSTEVIGGVGTLERNKESGLVKENAEILKDLKAPLQLDPIPPASLALLSSYPRILADLALTDGDMIRAVDASRASLALLDVGLGDLDNFLKDLGRSSLDFGGDLSMSDYQRLLPAMESANQSLAKAAVAAGKASQLFNMARSRQLQSRITMLGVGYPIDRYATLRRALEVRVKNPGLSYDAMVHDGLTPGEVTAATIVAADTNTTPEAIVAEAKSSGRTIVDVANERGMHAEALEIFLGLVYLDYTDDPEKEAHGRAA